MQCRSDQHPAALFAARVASAITSAIVAVVMSGCATSDSPLEFQRSTLRGVIIDENHEPVEWVSLSVEDGGAVYTDSSGRFAVPDVPRGEIRIRAERSGYEPLSTEFLFSNRTQLLYLQMRSGRFYVLAAVQALDFGDVDAAVRFAGRGIDYLPGDPEARFVAALASFLAGDLVAARFYLDEFVIPSKYEAVTLLRAEVTALEETER